MTTTTKNVLLAAVGATVALWAIWFALIRVNTPAEQVPQSATTTPPQPEVQGTSTPGVDVEFYKG